MLQRTRRAPASSDSHKTLSTSALPCLLICFFSLRRLSRGVTSKWISFCNLCSAWYIESFWRCYLIAFLPNFLLWTSLFGFPPLLLLLLLLESLDNEKRQQSEDICVLMSLMICFSSSRAFFATLLTDLGVVWTCNSPYVPNAIARSS